MKLKSVLLDTSFFIRLLNDEDPLHEIALGYYRYFLEKEIILKVSTITIAEYCVLGDLDDLPLKDIQILAFNIKAAQKTGNFAKAIFSQKRISREDLKPRAIIPNDSKLFAQADLDLEISYFVTSDKRSKNTLNLLKAEIEPDFDIISIDTPYNEVFGILDFY